MPFTRIPLAGLQALFLDAGHTVLCWDYAFASELLASLGIAAMPEAIARAEAASRPILSRFLARGASTEGLDARAAYGSTLLGQLDPAFARASADERRDVVAKLVHAMRDPDAQDRLWSQVPAGLPDALAALRDAGLSLVIVSNSDGTVEEKLRRAGIRELFDGVADSHLVGSEKPDSGIFHHALALAGVDPARTLHVGDLHAVDVVGAERAGLHAVLLDPFDDWDEVACARAADVIDVARRVLAARGRSTGGET